MNDILKVSNLSKKISNKFKIQDLSFDIKKGYVTGLIGSNGAGKTSLIKLLMGLYKKDGGNISIFNMDFDKNETKIKQDIGYVSDNPHYLEKHSLQKNAELVKPFFPNWSDEKFDEYMKFFELDKDKNFNELSKGMRIKFAIVMALSHNPKLLILDEPTAGIDPIFRREILDILYDFVSDNEKAVIFSTHITSDLDKIADYIIFIDDGKIVMNDVKDDILSQYFVARGNKKDFSQDIQDLSISYSMYIDSFESLVKIDKKFNPDLYNISFNKPSIEDIMFFYKKSKK